MCGSAPQDTREVGPVPHRGAGAWGHVDEITQRRGGPWRCGAWGHVGEITQRRVRSMESGVWGHVGEITPSGVHCPSQGARGARFLLIVTFLAFFILFWWVGKLRLVIGLVGRIGLY